MGISKRNPRGNFNWQNRILKRKADCCTVMDYIPPPLGSCYYYWNFSDIGLPINYTIFDPNTSTYISLTGDNVGDIVLPYLGGFGNVWYDVEVFPGDPPNLQTCTLGFILPSGSPIPSVDIRDSLGNQVPITYTECCTFGCYSTVVPYADSIISSIDTGEDYSVLSFSPFSGISPQPLDFTNPVSISDWQLILKRLYGSQFEILVIGGALGYTVYFNNVYVCKPIEFFGNITSYVLSEVICGALPQCYCYTITGISGTCQVDYIDCSGVPQVTSSDPLDLVYICAQDGSVSITCLPGADATFVKGTCVCDGTPPPSPLPPLGSIIGPELGICGASNVNYSLSTSNADCYNWIGPAGTTFTGSPNFNAVNVNFGPSFVSGTLTVQAFYGCQMQSTDIFIDGTPPTPIIDNDIICPFGDGVYTVSATGATSYTWTITDADFTLSTDPPTDSSYYILWGATGGTIEVTASNACGTSAPLIITTSPSC